MVLPLTDGWLEAVREHTDGRGVDMVVDPVGGEAFDDAIRALATEGRLLVIGFAAGGDSDRQGQPAAVAQRQRSSASDTASSSTASRARRRCSSSGSAKLVKAGLRPPPPVRFPLSEGRAALQSLADGGVLGKVVLEP